MTYTTAITLLLVILVSTGYCRQSRVIRQYDDDGTKQTYAMMSKIFAQKLSTAIQSGNFQDFANHLHHTAFSFCNNPVVLTDRNQIASAFKARFLSVTGYRHHVSTTATNDRSRFQLVSYDHSGDYVPINPKYAIIQFQVEDDAHVYSDCTNPQSLL